MKTGSTDANLRVAVSEHSRDMMIAEVTNLLQRWQCCATWAIAAQMSCLPEGRPASMQQASIADRLAALNANTSNTCHTLGCGSWHQTAYPAISIETYSQEPQPSLHRASRWILASGQTSHSLMQGSRHIATMFFRAVLVMVLWKTSGPMTKRMTCYRQGELNTSSHSITDMLYMIYNNGQVYGSAC